jgi:hypothetical protein
VQSLSDFIADIENNSITQNEIIICEIDSDIVEFLSAKGISLTSYKIILTVRRYTHILRDLKKQRGGAISKEIILNFSSYLQRPYQVYFDTHPKHKNIMYINRVDNQLFKIIINLQTNIVTVGVIQESNLKDKFLEVIK